MRPTIKQIAELSGVSMGTVDRVINNRGRVRPETKKKIDKIIHELDYKKNIFARNLVLDKSFSVGVIMPYNDQDGGYWQLPLEGIKQAGKYLESYRLNLIYFNYDKNSESSFKKVANKVLREKLDGILMVPIHLEAAKKMLSKLSPSIPYVIFDTEMPGANYLATIHQDAFHSGCVAAELMYKIMRKNSVISIVRFLPSTIHIDQRVDGFKSFLEKRSDAKLIITDIPEQCPGWRIKKIFDDLINKHDLKGIYVTGAHTFEIAESISDVKIKKNILLVGFDLIPANIEYMRRGIIDFLISQSPDLQGFTGVYALYRHLIHKEEVDKEIPIPIEIITKESLEFYLESKYTKSNKQKAIFIPY